MNRLQRAHKRATKRPFAAIGVCLALLAWSLVPASALAASSAVDLVVSVSDGGSPFVAQKDAATSSTPSGTWTVTVRNTGTSASSGTTTINFNANVNGNGTGYLLPGTGQGWTCDNGCPRPDLYQ